MIRFWSQQGDHDEQAAGLRIRIVIVGWLALAAGIGALLAAGDMLVRLDELLAVFAGRELPPLHVPPALRAAAGSPGLSWLALGMAFTGIWGMSTGRLRRTQAQLAIVAAVVVAIADIATCPPVRSPIFVIPSQLTRDVYGGRFGEAEAILNAHSVPEDANRYVRAQLALYAGDRQALVQQAGPLLDLADAWFYGIHDDNPGYWASSTLPQYRSTVLRALDVAANGHATAGVSLALERRRATTTSSLARLLGDAVAVIGLGLAAWGLFAVWRVMRRHGLAVADHLG